MSSETSPAFVTAVFIGLLIAAILIPFIGTRRARLTCKRRIIERRWFVEDVESSGRNVWFLPQWERPDRIRLSAEELKVMRLSFISNQIFDYTKTLKEEDFCDDEECICTGTSPTSLTIGNSHIDYPQSPDTETPSPPASGTVGGGGVLNFFKCLTGDNEASDLPDMKNDEDDRMVKLPYPGVVLEEKSSSQQQPTTTPSSSSTPQEGAACTCTIVPDEENNIGEDSSTSSSPNEDDADPTENTQQENIIKVVQNDETTNNDTTRTATTTTTPQTPTTQSLRNVSATCAICLCTYQPGEKICWSSHDKCTHAFHEECITNCLLASAKASDRRRRRESGPQDEISNKALIEKFNMDCPVCRQPFVVKNKDVLTAV